MELDMVPVEHLAHCLSW